MIEPHSFDEKLKEATEWEEKIGQNLVDLVVAEAWKLANQQEQRSGIDVVINLKKSTFDVKFRDYKYYLKGILIETFSVFEKGILGWFYTSQADEVIYLWWNEKRTGLMPIGFRIFIQDKRLREWFEKHRMNYPEKVTVSMRNRRIWHTRFVIVPIEDFPEGTIQRFNVRVKFQDPKQWKLNHFLE